MGFLLRTDTVTNAQAAVALQLYFPSNGVTATMTRPQMVMVMDPEARTVVVVGAGTLAGTGDVVDDTDVAAVMPAIAVVKTAGGSLCVTRLQVGNADTTFAGETYNDVVVDPWCCTGEAWLVAATATLRRAEGEFVDHSVTLLRRVSMDSLLPEPFGPEGSLFSTPVGLPTYQRLENTSSASVSLTTLSNMVVVGSHVVLEGGRLQSFLWGTTPTTLQVIVPSTTLSYNDPATGWLPLLADVVSVVLLRVFALPDDEVVAVSRAYTADEGCAVQVLRYTADTTLDVGFAVDGMLLWKNPDVVGGTYAMDAALVSSNLAPWGTVVVVGNSFLSPTDPDDAGAMHYILPGFEFGYLDVVSRYEPSPFAVEVMGFVCGSEWDAGGRAASNLVRPLFTQLCGCAAHWASSLAFTGPLSLVVTGDSWFHLGCPAQSAFVLDVVVGLGPAGAAGAAAAAGLGTGAWSMSSSGEAGGFRAGFTSGSGGGGTVGSLGLGVGSGGGGGGGGGAGAVMTGCGKKATQGKRGKGNRWGANAWGGVHLLNNTPACLPAIMVNPCAGVVTVDTLCPASTTLRVRGPIVVGCLSRADAEVKAVPGMMYYDADTNMLLLYAGDAWRAVQTQAIMPT
jgi:hypothetical protein